MTKWMTSGARRLKHGLKANHDRSFGARRNKKGAAAARSNDKGYESVVASAKIGESRRNNNAKHTSKVGSIGNPKKDREEVASTKHSKKKPHRSRSAHDDTKPKKSTMNRLPDYAGAMGGRMLSHPMYERAAAGAHAAAAADADALHPRIADRYAATAPGMDAAALQQELRRQEMLAAHGQGNGASSPAAAAAAAEREILRLQLPVLQDAHARIMDAELAARAMRDRITAQQHQQQQHQHAQQQHRQAHQEDSFGADSIERMLALQEQQAARQREMERIRQAEQLGAFGGGSGALHRHPSASGSSMGSGGGERERQFDAAAYGGIGMERGPSAQLAEERTLREHFMQRRILEEEVFKRQQQQEEAIKRQQEQQEASLRNQQQQQQAAMMSRGAGMDPVAAEEMALRERFIQRRMLEEEAIKERQLEAIKQQQKQQEAVTMNQQQQQQFMMSRGAGQGGAGPNTPDEREHLNRLLQLQQLSDEDLIQRASEIQRNKSAALEKQQMLEAQLMRTGGLGRFQGGTLQGGLDVQGGTLQGGALQGGTLQGRILQGNISRDGEQRLGLDMIDQAYADNVLARRMPGQGLETMKQGQAGQATSPTLLQQAGMNNFNYPPPGGNPQKPLRYFNNGIEVDMDGNPLQPSQASSPPNNLNMNPSPAALAHGSLNNGKVPSPTNNMANTNASMNFNANAASPMDNNIIAKFLTVVVSRVPEIAPAVADLLPDTSDPAQLKCEFPNVVEATLAELRSIRERFAGSSPSASSPAVTDLCLRVAGCIAAIEPYKVDLSAASPGGRTRQAAQMAAGMTRHQAQAPPPKPSNLDLNSFQPLMPNAGPAVRVGQPGPGAIEANVARGQTLTPVAKRDGANEGRANKQPESPADELPMMAAYKSKKTSNDEKKSKSKKSSGEKKSKAKKSSGEKKSKVKKPSSKKKKAKVPEVVHEAKKASVKTPTPKQQPRDQTIFRVSLPADNELAKTTASPAKRNAHDSPSKSQQGVKPRSSSLGESGGGEKRSRPMKKRRISHPASAENSNPGPHGALLDQLFGGVARSTATGSTENEPPRKSPENALITDESGHGVEKCTGLGRKGSDSEDSQLKEDDNDGRYDAASVLLGLMGR